jgi:hypothetical protein|tara:strand:+ start:587 stop:724 length:138 start_codon:yes stop_codon:yes gene_type:complete
LDARVKIDLELNQPGNYSQKADRRGASKSITLSIGATVLLVEGTI